jgi:ATP-binding cassette subfamily B protein
VIWLRVLRLFWKLSARKVTAFAVVSVLSAAIPGVQVALTASAVQSVAHAAGGSDGAQGQALRAGVALLLIAVAGHALDVWGQYLDSLLRLELTTRIGEQVMVKGTRLDLEQYENAEAYDNLQRAFQESSGGRIYQLFSELLTVSRELVTVVSVSIVLFAWSPWVAVFILVSPVPSVVAHMIYTHKAYAVEYGRAADRRRMYYYQYLTTTDHSFKEVRLFQLGPHFVERYQRLAREFFRVDRRLARGQSAIVGALGALSVLASSGALLWAIASAADDGQVGRLAGYLQSMGAIQASAHGMLLGIASLYKDTLFLGNLFAFLDLPERRITGGTRPFPAKLRKGIEFRDVSFVYPGTDRLVLDGVDFLLPAGECVALVGQNGAGKTSVVKLLTRLYEPTGGRILIDDVPIEEYDLDDLQRHIGVIFQDFIRYEMSVRDNIGFGRVEAMDDDERIRAAATAGGADTIVADLPDRYDTMLGRHFEEGRQLSGGQWQKVALSRAFMRKAPVVVLDEPTSAIDAEAETEIFGRLRDIAGEATSLIIAHRFSTVRIADRIVVLDRGRVIEEGTHDDLLGADGVYAHLFNLQAAGYLGEPASQ